MSGGAPAHEADASVMVQAAPDRRSAPVRNYLHQIVGTFSSPAPKTTRAGYSVAALAVLDAFDATSLRDERDDEKRA